MQYYVQPEVPAPREGTWETMASNPALLKLELFHTLHEGLLAKGIYSKDARRRSVLRVFQTSGVFTLKRRPVSARADNLM